jgi:hypothetical protein
MIESIKVVLPLPSKCLSPNARAHWTHKAGATKKARRLAREAIEAIELESIPWPAVVAQEAFFYPTRRRRDERNAVAMLKAYYDGFVDAGLIADDDHDTLSHEKPSFGYDKDAPRVEVTLRRADK